MSEMQNITIYKDYMNKYKSYELNENSLKKRTVKFFLF